MNIVKKTLSGSHSILGEYFHTETRLLPTGNIEAAFIFKNEDTSCTYIAHVDKETLQAAIQDIYKYGES